MDGSIGMGCMAVFAVSGSVAFLAIHAHNRLLSDYMKKIEFELGPEQCQDNNKKKKVRFAQNVEEIYENSVKLESTSKNKIRKPCLKKRCKGLESTNTMPQNRVALYRGIIQYRMLYPKKEYGVSHSLSRGRNLSHHHLHFITH